MCIRDRAYWGVLLLLLWHHELLLNIIIFIGTLRSGSLSHWIAISLIDTLSLAVRVGTVVVTWLLFCWRQQLYLFSVTSNLYVAMEFSSHRLLSLRGEIVGVTVTAAGINWLYATVLSLTQIRLVLVSHSCLLYTSPSPRDATLSRMPSSA